MKEFDWLDGAAEMRLRIKKWTCVMLMIRQKNTNSNICSADDNPHRKRIQSSYIWWTNEEIQCMTKKLLIQEVGACVMQMKNTKKNTDASYYKRWDKTKPTKSWTCEVSSTCYAGDVIGVHWRALISLDYSTP